MSRRIALVATYPPNRVPGLRFRIEQYLPFLREAGYTIEWKAFLSTQAYERFLDSQTGLVAKSLLISGAFLRAFWQALFRGKWDGIYLYREATLLGTSLIERLWMRRLPVVLDFDDAIWIKDVSQANKAFARLKSSRKVITLIKRAQLVTVCNTFLSAYVQQYHKRVRIIPTTIDTDLYRPKGLDSEAPVVIGWSGSATTTAHLRTIEPALRQLYEKYGSAIRFLFIGTAGYAPPFPAQLLPWRPETEVRDLQAITIGLMPLPQDEWSRGKCALKALQYMALGIPPVVSPVGMNTEVIQEGVNGLFARTPEEWVEKLSYLIENPEVRQRLGQAARATVEAHYSVKANRAKYLEVFETAFGKP
ncbi:MAG: glycosyltransferase family 4 protein [Bacteroidia bacterium]|nr:glycosyltransferase family 4 protein [Bacteroidia bacterium]